MSASGSGSTDFADGRVHTLTMGAAELRMVLESAAQLHQLVVVDFSASWCGPCKMMVPVLSRLAQQHRGKVVFCKVDCEETPRNRELAKEASISAFPTFQLYRSQQRVAEFRGANPAQLQQAIQQQLPLLPAAGTVAQAQQGGAAAGAAAPGPMATALVQALGRVRSSCSFDEFVAAARTLLTFVSNVLAHPDEPKYRRIRASNSAFHSKLGSKSGGKECMAALGFREQQGEEGETVLAMADIPLELAQVKTLLEQAIPGGGGCGTAGATPTAATASASSGRTLTSSGGMAASPWTAGVAARIPPAAASGNTAGAPTAAPSVDPAALTRALAGATVGLGARAPTAVPAGTAQGPGGGQGVAASGGSRGPEAPLHVTPALLARMLENILAEAGIGELPAAREQE